MDFAPETPFQPNGVFQEQKITDFSIYLNNITEILWDFTFLCWDGPNLSNPGVQFSVSLAMLVVMLAFPYCDRFHAGILNPPDPCRNQVLS